MLGQGDFCFGKGFATWELRRWLSRRRLAAEEMFWVHSGNALGSGKGLGLRLTGRWNKLVSHYDGSETRKGIRIVQKVKTL